MGETSPNDIYHFFREYPEYQRKWIENMPIGVSAFNWKIYPYKINSNGEKVKLKSGHLGNKFMRMEWNKPAPAIHTRSDQIASNRTIHPVDDRVLSIRELMNVMSIPKDFKWISEQEIKIAKKNNKIRELIRKNEPNIRRSIGEAVPTKIFYEIAKKIITIDLEPFEKLYELQYKEKRQEKNAAFYTPQSVVFNVLKSLKIIEKKNISILEPASGWGTFLPQIIKKFEAHYNEVQITLMDIDEKALKSGKKLFENIYIPSNIKLNWIVGNFLESSRKFDYIIGNPPYINFGKRNTFLAFLNKSLSFSENIAFIVPKTLLNSDAALETRTLLLQNGINSIIEFGVRTFNNVHIETIAFVSQKQTKKVLIEKYSSNFRKLQLCNYIFLDDIWIPYRDSRFDKIFKKMNFEMFTSFRDRQLTNKYLKNDGELFCIKSKNIEKNKVINKISYDKYVQKADTLHYFARTLLEVESKEIKKQQLHFKTIANEQQNNNNYFTTCQNVLSYFGIIFYKKRKLVEFDKNQIEFAAHNIENAAALWFDLMIFEFENIDHNVKMEIDKLISNFKEKKDILQEDIINVYSKWLNKCTNENIKQSSKDTSSMFSILVISAALSHKIIVTFPFTNIYTINDKKRNPFDYFRYEIGNKEEFSKMIIKLKDNAKSKTKREKIDINIDNIFNILNKASEIEYNWNDVSGIRGIETKTIKTTNIVVDPKVREYALEKYGRICMGNFNHKTFELRTGLFYIEAHHVIPKSLGLKDRQFQNVNLDVVENLIPLCPICHKHIHIGKNTLAKEEIVLIIWEHIKKTGFLKKITIGKLELFSIYKIVK